MHLSSLRVVVFTLLASAASIFAAPTVTVLSPAAGATISSLTQVGITFNEAITSVDANDLLINNEAALSVTGSGAGPYTFTFTQPPPGTVNISWDFDHGIAGIGTGAYAATTWAYTLTDTLPPAIGRIRTSVPGQDLEAIAPTPGATVAALTRVEVTFSEAVTGVDALDLLVGGVAATAVSGSEAGPYIFTVTQPAAGPVGLTWASGHGIVDTAVNAFGGGSWSVTLSAGGIGAPLINEFLAANATSIIDEDTNGPGWIEIYNPGPGAVSLLGWALTDNADRPTQWIFPARTLAANGYLVVFASGKNRKPATGNLHANFQINPSGGYLALVAPTVASDGTRAAVSAFPAFPAQRFDYSYGPQTGGALRYFARPGGTTDTRPGTANGTSTLTAVTPKPNTSVGRGYFKDPFSLVLSCADASATIRYTRDGSPVTAASPAYTAPLTVNATTVLRVAAFGATTVPSETVTHSYLFLDGALTQPSPPYDNPANSNDNTNPQPPNVGGIAFPVAWGSRSSQGFPGVITNLAADQVPADYGMDPEILNDPVKRDDNGAVNNATGRTNLERVNAALRTLPIMSVVMKQDEIFGTAGIYVAPQVVTKTPLIEKACSVELILPDGSTGFAITCGIRIHGNASRDPEKNPKHGFKLNFKGDYGVSSLKYQLFPESPVQEFDDLILRADFNSQWLHWSGTADRIRGTRQRDAWAKDTFRAMGRAAGHNRYVNLFINGVYWGVYDPAEQENNGFAAAYLGGKKDDYDVYDQGALKSGTATAYAAMTAIASPIDNPKYEQLKGYLDVPWFIDYMLLHFYIGHEDWGDDVNKNWYAVRNKFGGTFKYLPWDQENILRSETIDRTGVGSPPSGLQPKLVTNVQYKLDFADRAHRHLVAPGGALLPAANVARWNGWRAILKDALAAESARWGDYRRDVHRKPDDPLPLASIPLYRWNVETITEHNRLTGVYFPGRTATLLGQLRAVGLYPTQNAPVIQDNTTNAVLSSQRLAAGTQVKLAFPAPPAGGTINTGTIFFTTDGSDPRVYYAGSVAGTAQTYSTPLPINATTTIKARSRNGATWSALNEATFTVSFTPSPIRITEIMYNPTAAQGGTAAEFIELQNTSTAPVTMSGWSFGGIDFIFPNGFTLGAGDRIVLASNDGSAVFATTYPGVAVVGYFGGSLDNGGEQITLFDREGRVMVSADYDDAGLLWPATPDGGGYSLEIRDANGDPDDFANWSASAALKGSPGQANAGLAGQSIELSEVHTATGAMGFIELRNSSASPVDISGWTLRDGETLNLTVPASTTVAAGGFHTIVQTLSPAKGRLLLANSNGAYIDGVSWGAQAPGFSIGRVAGAWALNTPTQGAENIAATLAPVANLKINEWLANNGPGADDWLEVFNAHATQPTALQGLYFKSGSELYRFPSLAFVGAGQWVQLFAAGKAGGDQLDFKIAAGGSTLALLESGGATLDSVTFAVQAEGVTSGRLPDGTGAVVALQGSPSPSAANYLASNYSGPILNEVLVRNVSGEVAPWATRPGWIEFQNLGGSAFDMSGMKLNTQNSTNVTSGVWTFPGGSVVPAGKRLAVWCDLTRAASTTASSNLNCALGLSAESGGAFLFNATNQLVSFVEWGPQVVDRSIGRAGSMWTLLVTPTRGMANSPAAALGGGASVRINEWAAALTTPAGDWVELYNTGATPVALAGLYFSDDPSEVGRVKFRFAPLSYIGGNDWTQLIADDAPQLGRTHLPFNLATGGEYLRLSANDATVSAIDEVSFGTQSTTGTQGRLADGSATLAPGLRPTPGLANANPSTPAILDQPDDRLVGEGGTAGFYVGAAGAATLNFQWKKNGANIPGAQSETLTVGPATLTDEASYTVVISNGSGSVTSAPATLRVYRTMGQFTAAAGLTGVNAGSGADPDADGLSNVLEAFYNANPAADAVADRDAAAKVGVEPATGTPQFLTLTFRRNTRVALSSFGFEESLTLGAGTWTGVTPDGMETLTNDPTTGDPIIRVKFAVPTGETKRFIRLQVME